METNELKKGDLLEVVKPDGSVEIEEVFEVETEIPIFVYTAPSCTQCKMTKKFLDKAGKSYQEIDGTLEGVLEGLRNEGFGSFPGVKQGAVAFAGFRPDELRKLV